MKTGQGKKGDDAEVLSRTRYHEISQLSPNFGYVDETPTIQIS
jgi:hypothetical protein